jgi:cytochrome c biogenesis protein CcdA/glutaredoxin
VGEDADIGLLTSAFLREVGRVSKHMYWVRLLVFALLMSLRVSIATADEPSVGIVMFSTQDCEPCQRVEDLLSSAPSACEPEQGVEDTLYGSASNCKSCGVLHSEETTRRQSPPSDGVEVRVFDPTRPEDYDVLLELQDKRGVRIERLPALFIGDVVLEGEDVICEQLSVLIEDCLASGCPFPSNGQPSRMRELPSMIPPPQLLGIVDSPTPGVVSYLGTEPECPSCLFGAYGVQAAYFYRGTHWQEEQWSWFLMRYFLEHRQNLGLRTFDVDYPHNEALWQDLCPYYELSDACVTPAVFIGAYAFLGEDIEISPLVAAWKEYSQELMPAPWQLLEEGQPRPTAASAEGTTGAEAQASTERESEPVAHTAFFYSTTCPHCKAIEEEVLSSLRAKYGRQLDIEVFNVDKAQDYEVLLDLEARHGVHISEVPVIFIGDAILEEEQAIREGLEAQIERCLQGGGCTAPAERQSSGQSRAAESAHALPIEGLGPGVSAYRGAGMAGTNQPLVQMAYFFEQGCQECDRAWYDLRHLLGEVSNLYLRVYDIGEPQNKVLNEALCQHYGLPEQKHLSTPALFVGHRYFLGEAITLQQVEAAYQEYTAQHSPAPWELVAGETEQAQTRIVDRFRSFGPVTVVAAGLIDGLNPCAFATIIFFISYLAITGRRGREILTVGAAFTLGVFLAYLLVGVGLWKFLQSLGFLASLGRWVYLITALLCLFLALCSLLDYRKARRGELKEMTLSLPHSLRMRINRVIRQTCRARATVWAAFVTGLVVSIIELACTGQVYLPTIIFVMGVPQLQVRAFLYLLLYNLMFILPLVVVFILAFRGTTSRQLTRFLQARAAPVKLAMSGLFFALAGWLLYPLLGG